MTDDTNPKPQKRYIPLNRWPHAKTNGFEKVIKRVGRRVLIDEEAFFAWVEEQNEKR